MNRYIYNYPFTYMYAHIYRQQSIQALIHTQS